MINKQLIKNAWLHFKKICIHKFWVAYYCFKCGLYWQGITHDLSKFSWTEFWESVRFYQGTRSPIVAAKEEQGYSLAWQHHKGRNPHHYEYWTDKYDEGTVAIKMPFKYAAELICDYIGAARAYQGHKNFTFKGEYKWWLAKRETAKIHKHTYYFISHVFMVLCNEEMKRMDPEKLLSKQFLKDCYKYANYLV